jgi:hypothetical protein
MEVSMLSALAVAVLVVVGAQGRQDCAFEAERSANLAASGTDRLQVVARAGSLRVEGRAGLSEVRVRGRACASGRSLLERLTLEASRSGSEVRVEVAEVDMGGFRFWSEDYAMLDLVIEVPEGMAAEIRDGSGESVISALGSVRVTDGSGGLTIEDIRGPLEVEDGSGEITIDRVGGDVSVHDGSGQIDVRGVAGSLTVRDGSGEIRATDVTGAVRIPQDGSGSIRVTGVGGDFTVGSDGSGSISHSNVRGAVDIPDKEKRSRIRIRIH